MANKEIKLDLQAREIANGVSKVTGQLGGLEQVLSRLSGKLTALLAGASLMKWLTDAAVATGRLDKELTALRAALTRLKTAVGNAVAPILEAVLPAVRSVINAVVRAVNYILRLTQALFGADTAADRAAQGQDALADATERATRAAKRSLAAFDQLNRLSGTAASSGGTSPGTGTDGTAVLDTLLQLNLQELLFLDVLRRMLDALKSLDFSGVLAALEQVRLALAPLGEQLCAGLYWAFYNVLLPMSQWAVETLLPLFLQTLAAALKALHNTVEACRPALQYLWERFFKPLGQWVADTVVEGLEWLMEKLQAVSLWMEHNQVPVQWMLDAVAGFLAVLLLVNGALSLFNGHSSTSAGLVGMLASALLGLEVPIELITALVGVLSVALHALSADWTLVRTDSQSVIHGLRSDWQNLVNWFQTGVLTPLRDNFRTEINGIIGFFNTMLKGVTAGINTMIRALNSLSYTVPDWVPDLGGSTIGFSLSTIGTPRIPYLAKGAVLPANRPFLAVVGDQHHGTNIEAPLQTIQQAVALVMEDMVAGQMAGQEAVVAVLGQILEAVLGIRIGDADIALAVDRYRTKTAVITGR